MEPATPSENLASPPPAPPPPAPRRRGLIPNDPAERSRALRIAAIVGCDMRTALRAMRDGAGAVRGLTLRDALERAMRDTQ